MKFALVLISVLVAASSQAQTLAKPTCAPTGVFILGASGSPLLAGSNADGAWRGWWCPKSKFGWELSPYVHVALAAYAWSGNPNAQINQVLTAANPSAALLAAIEQFSIQPSAAQLPAFNTLKALGEAALRAKRPADPAFVVDRATRADGTRPVYALTSAGAPGLEVARAAAGGSCNCALAAIENGAKAWCPPAGAAPTLTVLCIPAP